MSVCGPLFNHFRQIEMPELSRFLKVNSNSYVHKFFSNFAYLIQVWAAQLKLGVGDGRLLYWISSRRKRRRGQKKKKGENGPKISWNRRSPHPLRQKILNQIKKCETIKYGTLWNIPLYSTMSCKKCSLGNNFKEASKFFAGTLDSNNCLTI